MKQEGIPLSRPQVYDFEKPADFLAKLLEYYKSAGNFSLRQRTSKVAGCSQTLVSQILKGQRQINRSNLPNLSVVFMLTLKEFNFIDGKLSSRAQKMDFIDNDQKSTVKKMRAPKNHLLTNWLHPYVKDLVHLKGFVLNPENLFSMTRGIAPSQSIKKSIEFLLKEGFWRMTPAGELAVEEDAVVTTNEIPNEKIKAFHARALNIALRGLADLPADRRKASTVLISVNQEHMDELRGLIESFQNQLLRFIERHPKGSDSLVQIAIHLTPVAETPR